MSACMSSSLSSRRVWLPQSVFCTGQLLRGLRGRVCPSGRLLSSSGSCSSRWILLRARAPSCHQFARDWQPGWLLWGGIPGLWSPVLRCSRLRGTGLRVSHLWGCPFVE
jgi:hypothetical protein